MAGFWLEAWWLFVFFVQIVGPGDGEFFKDGLSGLGMKVFIPEGGFEGGFEGAEVDMLSFKGIIGGVPEFRCGIGEMVEDESRGSGKCSEIDDPNTRDGSK